MCIIVAKYFDGIGWAGAKNRDRNYTPTLDFVENTEHGVERMMMHDKVTGYKEGINNYGLSILNTSLDVYDDESEVEAGTADTSPDGRHIAAALLFKDPVDAVRLLIKRKLGGCTIVFNKETMYLIEASDKDGKAPYKYKAKKIPNNETVARTNHGLWLPWAGYQRSDSNKSNSDVVPLGLSADHHWTHPSYGICDSRNAHQQMQQERMAQESDRGLFLLLGCTRDLGFCGLVRQH
mgnify:CR=1 FL=1